MKRTFEFNRSIELNGMCLMNRSTYRIDELTGSIIATRYFEERSGDIVKQVFPFNPETIEEDIDALRALAAISLEETRKLEEQQA